MFQDVERHLEALNIGLYLQMHKEGKLKQFNFASVSELHELINMTYAQCLLFLDLESLESGRLQLDLITCDKITRVALDS